MTWRRENKNQVVTNKVIRLSSTSRRKQILKIHSIFALSQMACKLTRIDMTEKTFKAGSPQRQARVQLLSAS
eukprot:1158398-Pelagomonas_calceolata.AAC.3